MSIYKLTGLDKYIPKLELSQTGFYVAVYSLLVIPTLFIAFVHWLDQNRALRDPKGCRKLGLRAPSNLVDEHHEKYVQEHTGRSDGAQHGCEWTVKSLWMYPIKSCRGVELNRGTIVSTGMQYDRQFTFAQLKSPFPVAIETPKDKKADHKWEFITQRSFPALARVRPEVWIPDSTSPTFDANHSHVKSGGIVIIRYPHHSVGWRGILDRALASLLGKVLEKSFQIPFDPTPEQIDSNGYTMEHIKIWKDDPLSLNMSHDVPAELKYFLGIRNPLALFRVSNDNLREVFRCAPREDKIGYQPVTGFADAYPLHILNLASVRDVGRRQPKDAPSLSAMQFRSNIIVSGPPRYDEDSWRRISIGNFEYYVSCRTARCKLPNVNQITGVKHPVEPDKTLRSFRCIDEGAGKNACLGMQVVPAIETSQIKVGDRVAVLDTGEHFYIKQ
ncbi:hypothetical protein MMC09_007083 [Bachmanniomyces sp. S44760]|nr:hypothetical protein [Bachmanniomyces sp. S44760]